MNDSTSSLISIYRSLPGIPTGFGPSVAAIGNFDGVHLGHRQILSAVAAEARELGMRGVAITFDPHPDQYLRPAQAPKLLTPLVERLRLLATTGIDTAVVLPFDMRLPTWLRGSLCAGCSWRRFVCANCMKGATSASAVARRPE